MLHYSESKYCISVRENGFKHISYLPVKVITDIFKVGEKRHWAKEARQLIPCHRGEAAVFKGTAEKHKQEQRWFRKYLKQRTIQRV